MPPDRGKGKEASPAEGLHPAPSKFAANQAHGRDQESKRRSEANFLSDQDFILLTGKNRFVPGRLSDGHDKLTKLNKRQEKLCDRLDKVMSELEEEQFTQVKMPAVTHAKFKQHVETVVDRYLQKAAEHPKTYGSPDYTQGESARTCCAPSWEKPPPSRTAALRRACERGLFTTRASSGQRCRSSIARP